MFTQLKKLEDSSLVALSFLPANFQVSIIYIKLKNSTLSPDLTHSDSIILDSLFYIFPNDRKVGVGVRKAVSFGFW